jgi:hypothetical protein
MQGVVTRHCATCRQPRPLKDFDLGGGEVSSTCLECVGERARTERRSARLGRAAKIASLESQRRSLIATLWKVDAEIAELRGRPAPPPVVIEDEDIVDTTFGEDDDFGDDGGDRMTDDVS